MATLAIGRGEGWPCTGVRRIRGALPVFQVAGIALRGKTIENPCGKLFMAFVALHSRVRSQEREAILVILHLLYSDIPSLNGVALRAVRAHQPAMNIGVTIRASLSDIRENWLNVAFNAFHFFVHPAQGVVRFVVVEFRNSADRPPTGRGVTVLAGYRERAVRIATRLFLRIAAAEMSGMNRHSRPTAGGGKCKERPECELE